MTHFTISFDAPKATGKALIELLVDQATNVSFTTVEPEDEIPTKKRASHKLFRPGTTTAHQVIYEMCQKAAENKVTKARIKQVFAQVGYNPKSSSAAISRLVATKKFAQDQTHVWMTDPQLQLPGLLKFFKK